MIKNMTRGSIVVEFQGRQATIEGEALVPVPGQPSYIIYADSLNAWDAPDDVSVMSDADRRTILSEVQDELRARGTPFEVDGEVGPPSTVNVRVLGDADCPRDGYWFTPARTNSRRYFVQGEPMPDVGGAYGTTIWQWDNDQS